MIRLRIALLFSGLTGVALLLFMTLIYVISGHYDREEFYRDLFGKARLEAQVQLEKDELTHDIYEELIERHLEKLPQEIQVLLEISQLDSAVSAGLLGPAQATKILADHRISFTDGDRHWAGIFYEDNEGDFVVLISAVNELGQQKQEELLRNMFFGLLITMFVQFLVGYFFARTIVHPLIGIGHQAERIRATDLSARFVVRNPRDELGQVASRLNDMLDRLEQGFDSQRKFISSVSHELKTPLTAILGQSEYALEKDRDDTTYRQALEAVQRQAEKLHVILTDLIQLTEVSSAGSEYFEKEAFQIEDLVLELMVDLPAEQVQRIHIENIQPDDDTFAQDHQLKAKRRWVLIAVNNVLENALKFSDGPVTVRTFYSSEPGRKYFANVEITDRGVGVPSADLSQVTNPFFRAGNVKHVPGSGVGLSIVLQIMRLHGGDLRLQSASQSGTVVRLIFPIPED